MPIKQNEAEIETLRKLRDASHVPIKQKRQKSDYWKKRPHMVYKMNIKAILAHEDSRGVPRYKMGGKIIKELTRRVGRGYIPEPFRGNKKIQLTNRRAG